MNGFIQIVVRWPENEVYCWQKIVEGSVVEHVDNTGATLTLPKIYESTCVTGELVDALPV